MVRIETKYYNPHGDKSKGTSHPMEDLAKFFYDVIKEMEDGEQCTRDTLLMDYRNAGGNTHKKALGIIDLRLSTFSLPTINSHGNGMVEKFLVGPDGNGVYTRHSNLKI